MKVAALMKRWLRYKEKIDCSTKAGVTNEQPEAEDSSSADVIMTKKSFARETGKPTPTDSVEGEQHSEAEGDNSRDSEPERMETHKPYSRCRP